MLHGNPHAWARRFRGLDILFLERVVALWPQCISKLNDGPDEDTITINLVSVLSKDAEARRLFHHLEYQYEPFGYTADGWAYSKGKIDMALLLDQEREKYLAYECKRLNVTWKGKMHSLARQYVMEGICRFITEQYAEDLPLGCMLGYVMDGNADSAQRKVREAITKHSSKSLAWGPNDEESLGPMKRFSSGHNRKSTRSDIEIRHALIPYSFSGNQGKS